MKTLRVISIIFLFVIIIPVGLTAALLSAFGPSDSLNVLAVMIGLCSGIVGATILA